MFSSKSYQNPPFYISIVIQISSFSVHYKSISFLLMFLNSVSMINSQINTMTLGALLDNNTRMGKEMRTALKVAGQNFNESSTDDKAFLHIIDPGQNPLQAVDAAEVLVKEKNVQSIIVGISTWEETALVASFGNEANVPIISFAESAIEKQIMQQWPFMIQMVPDIKEQIKCIVDIVSAFQWRKVIVINEVDLHGSDSGAFALLSIALGAAGIEIEDRVVFPPLFSLLDPEKFVREEVVNLLSKQSRVFIVLKSSLTLGIHLFTEAKKMSLVQKDSAWIISEPLAGLLNSVNTSVASSMEGALGVTADYSESSTSFIEFKQQFQKNFWSDYPEEDNSEPRIYALRVFDSFAALTKAIAKLNGTSNSTLLLKTLLSSYLAGLSGLIRFQGGELLQSSALKILNVSGQKARKVGVWSSELGFSKSLDTRGENGEILVSWFHSVTWPGNLNQIPNGWSMPTDAFPLKIGVPGRTSFSKFVNVTWNSSINDWSCSGYSIDVFTEVLKILEPQYHLPHVYKPFNGSYDELVLQVANKTFDAVVGDVTILASRAREVQFTQPYTESRLTMVVTVKSRDKGRDWIFVKPFTGEMWAVTLSIFLYTVLAVWLLERQINPEFEGRWWNQLNTALWFICSSLFFAQRERIYSNYSRMVVLVWLFVVLVLTSSYTANLSSLLTVPQLEPNVTDIRWLKANNLKIGCDGDSFVRKYLEDVLHFQPDNIMNIGRQDDYPKEFESGNIAAAFLELPYEKAYLCQYCEGYTVANDTSNLGGDRFGGLGFVFPKGSPLADVVSEAILTLSENGKLKDLELQYFSPPVKCPQTSDDGPDRLDWKSFYGLYLFCAGNSTFCCLIFLVRKFYRRWQRI